MEDEMTYKNVVYRRFPRMDGLKDLYRSADNRVFSERSVETETGKHRRNLYCAWKIIKMTNEGLPLETDGCDANPSEHCRHVVTPVLEEIHFLFRALRIALCSLKSRDIYPKLVKAEIENVIEVLQTQYARIIELSPSFYKSRDNAWKYLRTHKRPWAMSKSLEVEMENEERRHPGFRALVDGIAARVERAREAEEDEDSEQEAPIPPAEEHPHAIAVREAAVQYALGKEEVFEKVVVFTRTRTGVPRRTRIVNP
jgi:hypothetical protein